MTLLYLLACAAEKAADSAPPDGDTASACAGDSGSDDAFFACGGRVTIAGDASASASAAEIPHGPVSIVVGDLAGDGAQQIYVGTNRSVTRFEGPDWASPLNIWTQADDGVAVYPTLADVDGDGQLDLVLGLPGSDDGDGQVVVFEGPVTGPVDWSDEPMELKGTGGGQLGYWPQVVELTGDGVPDLLVETAGESVLLEDPFLGGAEPSVALAYATWSVSRGGTVGAPHPKVHAGDLDGDGALDALFSSPTALVYDAETGCPHATGASGLYLGPVTPGAHDGTDADALLWGDGPYAGADVVGLSDVDGDGALDIVRSEILDVGGLGFAPATTVHRGPFQEDVAADFVYSGILSPVLPPVVAADGTRELLLTPNLWLAAMLADARQEDVLALTVPVTAAPFAPFDLGTCAVAAPLSWVAEQPHTSVEADWAGDLDGDGAADAVFASSDPETGDGLLFVIRGVSAP